MRINHHLVPGLLVAASSDLIVNLSQHGKLKGKRLQVKGYEDAAVFYGVPYAVAPSGERRFEPPQSLKTKWDGVRDATQIGGSGLNPGLILPLRLPLGVISLCLQLLPALKKFFLALKIFMGCHSLLMVLSVKTASLWTYIQNLSQARGTQSWYSFMVELFKQVGTITQSSQKTAEIPFLILMSIYS